MANKLDRLFELNELLKSGAINDQEFKSLKQDILSNNDEVEISDENQVSTHRKKIILKPFSDYTGKSYPIPNVDFIDIDNLSQKDIEKLSPFIRSKQILAPEQLTEDEIKIGNKIFSTLEISEMNSERNGLNYPWLSLLGVLCAGLALFVIMVSPCLIFIVGGSSFILGLFFSISVLNKVDSTKTDKVFGYIGLMLSIISVIIYITWKPFENSDSVDNIPNAQNEITEKPNSLKQKQIEYNSPEISTQDLTKSTDSDNKSQNYLSNLERKALVVKDLMTNFYSDLSLGNFDASKYFDNNVSQFITKKNITIDEINLFYNENTDYTQVNAKLSNNVNYYSYDEKNNDIEYYNFWIDYQCYRPSKTKYQKCKIYIEVGINTTEFKINSYKEKKIIDLEFFDNL